LVVSRFIYRTALLGETADDEWQSFYWSLDDRLHLAQSSWPGRPGTAAPFIFNGIYGRATRLWQGERAGPVLKTCRVELRVRRVGGAASWRTRYQTRRRGGRNVLMPMESRRRVGRRRPTWYSGHRWSQGPYLCTVGDTLIW